MKHFHYINGIVLVSVLLGIYNGKIALWKSEDPEPVKVFPYSVRMLPPAAQRALRKGIRAENIEELYRLVEDYLP